MKKLFLFVFCFCFLFVNKVSGQVVLPVINLEDTRSYNPYASKMTLVMNCYSGRSFTGSSYEKRLTIPSGTSTFTFSYNDEPSCLSYIIMGIGFNFSETGMFKKEDYMFSTNFSFSFQEDTATLNQARTETFSNNSQVVQTVSLNEPPTVLTGTSSFATETRDGGAWLRNGFPSAYHTWPLQSSFVEVANNEADRHPDGGGALQTLETHTYNVNIIGKSRYIGNQSPFSDGNMSLFFGDYGYTGTFLLYVNSAWHHRLIINKGPTTFYPTKNFTDLEEHQLLEQIKDAIQANSTGAIVTAINNQTTQQEAAAQQRQEEIMDSDTEQGEDAISDFMTSFDDGSDPTLAGIITKPLELLQALTSTSCVPLSLTLPYVEEPITLPCGRTLISQNFSAALSLWDIFSTGLIAYWIGTRLFVMIHEFKNPDNDGNIEPLEL